MTKAAKGDRTAVGGGAKRSSQANPAAMTTLKDIAELAGVSAQTVSRVMNNSSAVSDEARERIRQIADRMGYRPNKSAKAMRTGRSQTLGLVISDMGNPFYPELAQAVERAAAAAGYAVLLVDAYRPSAETAERIAALKSHPVDGVIATEYSAALGRLDLPTVLIGGPATGMDSVNSDDIAGGAILAEHLLSQGHRSFGLVTGPRGGCIPVRRNAFVNRVGTEGRIAWECYTPLNETISDEIRAMLMRRDMTAIVCSNDLIAIGVLRILRELGREVPADVSVVGFDDIPWAGIVTPTLTTVRQPFAALGTVAVDLLVQRLANPRRRCRNLRLGVSLIERGSVERMPVALSGVAAATARAARLHSETGVQ